MNCDMCGTEPRITGSSFCESCIHSLLLDDEVHAARGEDEREYAISKITQGEGFTGPLTRDFTRDEIDEAVVNPKIKQLRRKKKN